MSKYVIGLDFGTKSGRAVLVNVSTGEEVADAVHEYRKGVISDIRPGGKTILKQGSALQDPNDYVETLISVIPVVIQNINSNDVIGVGVDFTSCTLMVTKRDSAPLCNIDEFKYEPHSWVKLWKHHASQSEADTINELADDLEAEFRHRYCRKSAEWFFPKVLVACPHKGYHFLC